MSTNTNVTNIETPWRYPGHKRLGSMSKPAVVELRRQIRSNSCRPDRLAAVDLHQDSNHGLVGVDCLAWVGVGGVCVGYVWFGGDDRWRAVLAPFLGLEEQPLSVDCPTAASAASSLIWDTGEGLARPNAQAPRPVSALVPHGPVAGSVIDKHGATCTAATPASYPLSAVCKYCRQTITCPSGPSDWFAIGQARCPGSVSAGA